MMKKLTTWAYMQLINKTGISKSTKLKRQSSLLSHSKNCNSKPAAPCRHGHQSIVFETMHSANPAPLVDGRNGNSLFLVFVHMNCLLNCSTSSQQRERESSCLESRFRFDRTALKCGEPQRSERFELRRCPKCHQLQHCARQIVETATYNRHFRQDIRSPYMATIVDLCPCSSSYVSAHKPKPKFDALNCGTWHHCSS